MTIDGPPVHVPPWQASAVVQMSLSLHVVPLGALGFVQAPVVGLHMPATWHWSLAVQTMGLAPAHAPAWQVSVCVHALPSVQAVPSGASGFEQVPLAGLHVPASWHWSLAEQTTGLAPAHVPAWQVSVCVQALPSVQAVPLGASGSSTARSPGRTCRRRGTGRWRCRRRGCAPVQAPAWHVSVCVQALPSLQAVPLGCGRVRADARRRVARAGDVALVAGRADDGVGAGAGARLAGVASACRRCRRCRPCRWARSGSSRPRSPDRRRLRRGTDRWRCRRPGWRRRRRPPGRCRSACRRCRRCTRCRWPRWCTCTWRRRRRRSCRGCCRCTTRSTSS